MAAIQSHRDLEVWRSSMDLVVKCYEITRLFPKSETYGLSSQLQRAAVSVPTNVAEGNGRNSTREYIHHLSIAYGSLMELETHLQIAHRLGYATDEAVNELLHESGRIGRMLNGLQSSLERRLG